MEPYIKVFACKCLLASLKTKNKKFKQLYVKIGRKKRIKVIRRLPKLSLNSFNWEINFEFPNFGGE